MVWIPLIGVLFALAAWAVLWFWPSRPKALPPPEAPPEALAEPEVPPEVARLPAQHVAFDAGPGRGTASLQLEAHAGEWRTEMRALGLRLLEADVRAVVFVHGTFVGTDPVSAARAVERGLPLVGSRVAAQMRSTTRRVIGDLLGDVGNFGLPYARLFEQALGANLPATVYAWSSENHHTGRLEGALGLIRVLATHAELAEGPARRSRLLVVGHSHAGQLFALITQLLAGTAVTEAALDVARVRGIDVDALALDLETLGRVDLDFVTLGAPERYAWAGLSNVRALHVMRAPRAGEGPWGGDLVARLGGGGATDLPVWADKEGRRAHLHLAQRLDASEPRSRGPVVWVTYPSGPGPFAEALGHGSYTRLDAMLFHTRLILDRLYPASVAIAAP